MTLVGLAVRYALFAALAMTLNLGVQRLILDGSTDPVRYVAALGCGTLVGLVVKYVLDKRWIFRDIGTGLKQHGTKFSLYAFMGVFTTAIFWGTETAFWLIGKTELMREAGAVLGLVTGYVIKYQLDSRYVFTDALARRKAA